jgi:hypothetical protein
MKRITTLIALALGVLIASPVLAEDDQTSGNYWLRECKKDPKQLAQSSGTFQYGWCFGVIYGVSIHSQRKASEHRIVPYLKCCARLLGPCAILESKRIADDARFVNVVSGYSDFGEASFFNFGEGVFL